MDGETGNSTPEELKAPLDDGSGQELEGAVAAEPDIPKDKEQETQEVVQVTSILDKVFKSLFLVAVNWPKLILPIG